MTNLSNQTLPTGCKSMNLRGARLAKASTIALTLGLAAAATSVSAQTANADGPDSRAAAAPQNEPGDIVVTANRRNERITDVPYNITAVGAENLAASSATSANDLTKVVAGLGSFSSGAADLFGENNFTLRGLRTDPAGQNLGQRITVNSVATYYGDTPVFFSLLLKDLERVEVLRGPQGTLYGSGAQAGAIRFIPKRPSFDAFSGEVNAATGITYSASKPNANVDAVINIPVAENFAIRVSGAYVYQAGFIDQVNLFEQECHSHPVPSVPQDLSSGPVIAPIKKNTNSSDQWMARAALRYQPTDWLDIDASYLHQDTRGDDFTASNAAYGGGTADLSGGTFPNAPYQTRPGGKYRNTQPIEQPVQAKLDLVSGTAAFDLGFAQLSSITSYYKSRINSTLEGSAGYVNPLFNFVALYNHYPRFTDTSKINLRETGFTQEVRLVSQGASAFSYVLGAYYQKQDKDIDNVFFSPGLQAFSDYICPGPDCLAPGANPQATDIMFSRVDRYRNSELAVFGELTYKFTDAWQVTGGMRVFKTKSSISLLQKAPFFGTGGDGTEPIGEGTAARSNSDSISDRIFKANTSYEFALDNRLYATFAQGFRRGGANPIPTTGQFASLPEFATFRPDVADNYEIGIKGRTLGRRLTYSLAAFWINQKNFQFTASTPSFYQAVINGEKLQSRGFEAEGSFRVTPELTVSASYAYTDAKTKGATVVRDLAAGSLADGFQQSDIIINPNATVADGAILPGVSKHSAIAGIDYAIRLAGAASVNLHANATYRSKQKTDIASGSASFTDLPDVFMADARITFDSGKGWLASLFVTNLTNTVGYSGVQGVQIPNVSEPQAYIYASRIVAQPRTFGLSMHYGF